jgi:hypothetical protein
MEVERKELQFLDAQDEFEQEKWWHSRYEKDITGLQDSIRRDLEKLEASRERSANSAKGVFGAGLRLAEAKAEWDAKKTPNPAVK